MKNKLHIIYLSRFCHKQIIKKYFDDLSISPVASAAQKFHRLILDGLSFNGIDFETISDVPLPTRYSRKLFFPAEKIMENNRISFYCPIINVSMLRTFYLFLVCCFKLLIIKKNRNTENFIICDALIPGFCLAAILIGKIKNIPVVGIVTDVPCACASKPKSLKEYLSKLFIMSYINSFSCYILLTKAMNELVNQANKPYMVMEGLVEQSVQDNASQLVSRKKIILYAGGLCEEYGIKTLVEAFLRTQDKEWQLWFYGKGDFAHELSSYTATNDNIKYFGVAPNECVLQAEYQAMLLVNPRPSIHEFTKYSFPSKNMEYMASGTPLLTTILPGMPKEYYKYVYLCDDESVDGWTNILQTLFNTPSEELIIKGNQAKEFVLQNKNNIFQTRRIIDFINEYYKKNI